MADSQDDYPAHLDTYTAFNKLVTFTLLWIVLLLASMALGLVGKCRSWRSSWASAARVALLVAFAVLG